MVLEFYYIHAMQWLGDVEYAYACEQSIEAGAILIVVELTVVFRGEIYDGGKADLGII